MTDSADSYAEFRSDNEYVTSDYDWGLGLLGTNDGRSLNCDAQLAAISDVRRLQRTAKAQRTEAISQLEALARDAKDEDTNEHFISEWLGELEADTYEDAAHSMAIIGMLAPLIETIFYRAFLYLGSKHSEWAWDLKEHDRWTKDPKKQWDCYYVKDLTEDDKDIVRGILELADATGVAAYLPLTFRTTLEAIFQYRNKMFHNGLEWPQRQLEKFEKNSAQWSGWFSSATIDTKPAFFYATDKFVDDCISMINQSVEALGKYARLHVFNR